MNLKSFEIEVEPKIIARGKEYYRDGNVKKPEKVGAEEFSATVFGTERYSVYVKLKDDVIIEHECDCPYDYGNVCKHKVAVFYSIRNGDFSDTSDKLNALAANLHEAALRKYIAHLLKKDTKFRRDFLREFDEDFEEEEFEEEEDENFDEDYY